MSDPGDLLGLVRDEVVGVHDFIQSWIRGDLDDNDAVWGPFADRFAADFSMIAPRGELVPPEDALPGVRAMHGSNPDFEIWTGEHALVHREGTTVVARYTEWQENARHAPDPTNCRWSTVVFTLEEGELRWRWLHETWMPPA